MFGTTLSSVSSGTTRHELEQPEPRRPEQPEMVEMPETPPHGQALDIGRGGSAGAAPKGDFAFAAQPGGPVELRR
jgi:hypothetical protein